jgi:hypothetical protein
MDVVTSGAGFARHGRWHKQNWNSSNSGFIQNVLPETVKSPVVCFSSLFFATRFLIQRLSDISQIFKYQRCVKFFSFSYKLFRNIVVDPRLKTTRKREGYLRTFYERDGATFLASPAPELTLAIPRLYHGIVHEEVLEVLAPSSTLQDDV